MQKPRDSAWFMNFVGIPVKPAPKVVVYLLGHAGGTPADFRRWDLFAGPDVRLVPIALPGRATRQAESSMTDVHAIADVLAREIAMRHDATSPAFALFGQSFGSLVAYETAVRLSRPQQPAHLRPVGLIVSARRAPHMADPRPGEKRLSECDDAGLVAGLSERYGDDTLATLMREQPVIAMRFVPQMRADITAFDRYKPAVLPGDGDPRPLACPVFACSGETDPRMTDEEGRAWGLHSSAAPVPVKRYPGGHFFVRNEAAVKLLVQDIEHFVLDALKITKLAPVSAPAPASVPAPAPAPASQKPQKKAEPVFVSDFDDPDFPACF